MKNENINSLTELQLVSFLIDNETFGIEILKVQEIIRTVEITKIPKAPDFVEGIINLRGQIIPVIDLRNRFGKPPKNVDNKTRIIVVDIEGKITGFIVDEVSEVLRINEKQLDNPPDLIAGIDSEFITKVGKVDDNLIILLELSKVLSLKEKREIKKIA